MTLIAFSASVSDGIALMPLPAWIIGKIAGLVEQQDCNPVIDQYSASYVRLLSIDFIVGYRVECHCDRRRHCCSVKLARSAAFAQFVVNF